MHSLRRAWEKLIKEKTKQTWIDFQSFKNSYLDSFDQQKSQMPHISGFILLKQQLTLSNSVSFQDKIIPW